MTDIQERGYTSPDVLVATDWVAQNLENPEIRIIESNEDPLLYLLHKQRNAEVQRQWSSSLGSREKRTSISVSCR